MRSFEPVARSFAEALPDWYAGRGVDARAAEVQATIRTNSELAPQRAALLLRSLDRPAPDDLRGLRILDVGCGFGALSAYFALLGAEVTALDPDPALLGVGRAVTEHHGLRVGFHRVRIEEAALEPSAHDVAIVNNSRCYIVGDAARRIAHGRTWAALVPGGRIVLRDPNPWCPLDPFTKRLPIASLPAAAWLRTEPGPGRRRPGVRLVSPPAGRRELREAGFADVRIRAAFGWLSPHYHLSARRPAA